jgi:hypothetical protein
VSITVGRRKADRRGRLPPGQAPGVGWAQRSTNARATPSTIKTRTKFLIAPSLDGSADGWATEESYTMTGLSASREAPRHRSWP